MTMCLNTVNLSIVSHGDQNPQLIIMFPSQRTFDSYFFTYQPHQLISLRPDEFLTLTCCELTLTSERSHVLKVPSAPNQLITNVSLNVVEVTPNKHTVKTHSRKLKQRSPRRRSNRTPQPCASPRAVQIWSVLTALRPARRLLQMLRRCIVLCLGRSCRDSSMTPFTANM